MINNVGPIVAANNAKVTITCLTGAGKFLIASNNLVNRPTNNESGPVESPKLSCNASQALLKVFKAPDKF